MKYSEQSKAASDTNAVSSRSHPNEILSGRPQQPQSYQPSQSILYPGASSLHFPLRVSEVRMIFEEC